MINHNFKKGDTVLFNMEGRIGITQEKGLVDLIPSSNSLIPVKITEGENKGMGLVVDISDIFWVSKSKKLKSKGFKIIVGGKEIKRK